MSLRALFCSHAVYIDEIHRLERMPGEPVIAACFKCQKPMIATCGLTLPAKLMGIRPKACVTCKGSGVQQP